MVSYDMAEVMPNRWPNALRRGVKVLLFGFLFAPIVAGVLVFASATLPAMLGSKTMVVNSGSMSPAISAGDAVLIRPAPPIDSIRVGDVITYRPYGVTTTTTHRVVAIKTINGQTYFQTKGDANQTTDPDLAPAENVYGKVTWKLPYMGYLLYFASTGWGKVFIFGGPSLMLMAWEISRLLKLRRQLRVKAVNEGPDKV